MVKLPYQSVDRDLFVVISSLTRITPSSDFPKHRDEIILNPYRPTVSHCAVFEDGSRKIAGDGNGKLAGKKKRLLAAFIDSFFVLVLLVFAFVTGAFCLS